MDSVDSSLLLATYGTLRRCMGGFDRLDLADRVTFRGACAFTGTLYDLGQFPGAVKGSGTVQGDLFELHDSDVLQVVDRYEGYAPQREDASLFVRRRVPLDEPADCSAWVYWYNETPASATRVGSGDWEKYRAHTGSA